MATSTRERIITAALTIAEERESVEGVTVSLESVARRAGLTKPGLMYHFPTKEALMLGLVDHAARRWSEQIRAEAGGDPGELSAFDRHRAYVKVAMTAERSRGDYWVFSDALYQPALSAAWHRHLTPWFAAAGLSGEARALLTVARFAADGAWISEATALFRADDRDLAAARVRALRLIDEAEVAA
ncbi:TetR/AcrR family transcriptional regulator [Georgenia halophila]|uniref:TetR/AcrR family transcriptional regulator n=1 Tax=Georgenia halophila TaxID=620889 RepID=A0ABP8LK29_9MICO